MKQWNLRNGWSAGAALVVLCLSSVLAVAEEAQKPAPAAAQEECDRATMTADGVSPAKARMNEIKQPVEWFKWGGDVRMRAIWDHNATTLRDAAVANERFWQRFRARVWWSILPVDDVEINARLTWEFINFCRPAIADLRSTNFEDVIFDNLNVHVKNIGGIPLSLKVGRQDFAGPVDGYGDYWLILDGTPLDGSRTIYFDAIRTRLEVPEWKSTFDWVVVGNQSESDHLLYSFGSDMPRLEHDEVGSWIYMKNRSLENTAIDAYFMYVHRTPQLANGDDAHIYTYGGRLEHKFDENWTGRAEIAQQVGRKNGDRLCALGFNSRVTYFWNDAMKNQTRLSYEYLSGDDPSTDTNEQFDNLWGRWPQWSELYQGWTSRYRGEFRPGELANFHRIGLGHSVFPCKPLEFCADYHLLFADENTRAGDIGFSDSGCFRGQLLALLMRYTILDPKVEPIGMTGHAIAEFFFPGDYYSDFGNDPAVFLRYELTISW